MMFIYTKFQENPQEIKQYLVLIFTIYMAIYIMIKILWNSYKVTFEAGEERYVPISKLTKGMIICKKDLIKNI